MYTLNDEWWIPRALDLVEKEGETLGYRLVYDDVGGCAGGKASWYLEKNGYRNPVEFERLRPDCTSKTIQRWLRGLTS